MKEHFDVSKFEPINPYYEPGIAANNAMVEKMKDEVSANPIAELVGLRLQMYSYEPAKINRDRTTDRFDFDHAKGIQLAAAERFLHQQYFDLLHTHTENYALNCRLGCGLNQINGIEVSHPSQNIACPHLFLRI